MQKLMIVFSLLCLGPLSLASEIQCYQEEKVAIQEPKLRIKIVGEEDDKKKHIVLRLPVDCETGKAIVPTSMNQAIVFLDFALPFEYKAAAVRESLKEMDTVTNTDIYIYNEMFDILDFFEAKWGLDDGDICKAHFSELFISCSACSLLLMRRFVIEYMDKVKTLDGLINLD